MGKGSKWTFLQKGYTNGQTYSTSLVIRKMQITITMNHHFMPTNTAIICNWKNSKKPMWAKTWEKLQSSYTTHGNIKWYCCFRKSVHSTLRYIPSGNENTCPHKNSYTRLVSSGCRNNYHRWSGLNRHLSCHSSGGKKPRIKVLATWVSGESVLPMCRGPCSDRVLTWPFLCADLGRRKRSSSYQNTSPVGLEPYPYHLISLSYLPTGPITKYQIQPHWRLGLQQDFSEDKKGAQRSL